MSDLSPAVASSGNPADPFAILDSKVAQPPAEPEGSDGRLTEHNRRVLRWAKAYDSEFRDVALLLGWATDRDTLETWRRGRAGLVRLSVKHCREGRMDKPLSEATLRRRIGKLEEAGVLGVDRGKQGFGDKRRGMQASNVYAPDFTKVIFRGQVVSHDFAAPLECGYSPQYEPQETVTEPQVSPYLTPCLAQNDADAHACLAQDTDGLPDNSCPASPDSSAEGRAADGRQAPEVAPFSDPVLNGHVRFAWKRYAKSMPGLEPADVAEAVGGDIAWYKIANPHAFISSANFRERLARARGGRFRRIHHELYRMLDAEADEVDRQYGPVNCHGVRQCADPAAAYEAEWEVYLRVQRAYRAEQDAWEELPWDLDDWPGFVRCRLPGVYRKYEQEKAGSAG